MAEESVSEDVSVNIDVRDEETIPSEMLELGLLIEDLREEGVVINDVGLSVDGGKPRFRIEGSFSSFRDLRG